MFSTNSMTRLFSPTAIALLALGGTLIPGATRPARADDIIGTAIAAGHLNTFVATLQASGFADTLKGAGPFTVFAPTDAAFAKLPKGMLPSLFMPGNRATMVKILSYHVISGKITAKQILAMKSGSHTPATVEGQPLTIKIAHGVVHVNNAKVVKTDIKYDNGIIHVIDTVLLPPAGHKMPSSK